VTSADRRAVPAAAPSRRALGALAVVLLGSAGAAALAASRQPSPSGDPNGSIARRVVLDAGHGGRDPGAVSPVAPLVEAQVALQVALLTGARLQRQGIGVVYTRTDDRSVSLGERAALAGRSGAGLLLSLHLNAAPNPAVRGAEAWHGAAPLDVALAEATLAGLGAVLRDHDAGVRGTRHGPGLAVLRTPVPATLVELGYLTSPRDAALLTRPAFLEDLAEGLTAGVLRFLDARGGAGGAGARQSAPDGGTTRGSDTGRTYRIRPGDTLSEIAQRHGVSLEALQAANPLDDPHRLRVGTTLTIPSESP
jgi:N-acetylmuramoyl-L-alanine amidase